MERLEKYIKMCCLSVRQRYSRVDKHEEKKLQDWLEEDEVNEELYDSIERVRVSDPENNCYKCDVGKQLERFHRERKCASRAVIWRWSVAACICMIAGGVALFMANEKEQATLATITPLPEGVCLVLADGRQVSLTTEQKEPLAIGTAVADVKSNTIVYAPNDTVKGLEYNTLIVPLGTAYHLILSDGTRVWLNAGSKITYPVVFPVDSRNVELEGEAFFEVRHDEKAPFSVKTDRINIEVLGTEFNVNTFADGGYVSAALVKGVVEVFGPEGNTRQLIPGQVAEIGPGGSFRVVTTSLRPYVAWKDNLFCFRNTPLREILKQVGRYYDVTFNYLDFQVEEYYTGDISRDKPLRTLLDVIEITIPVQFEINGREVIVTKRS